MKGNLSLLFQTHRSRRVIFFASLGCAIVTSGCGGSSTYIYECQISSERMVEVSGVNEFTQLGYSIDDSGYYYDIYQPDESNLVLNKLLLGIKFEYKFNDGGSPSASSESTIASYDSCTASGEYVRSTSALNSFDVNLYGVANNIEQEIFVGSENINISAYDRIPESSGARSVEIASFDMSLQEYSQFDNLQFPLIVFMRLDELNFDGFDEIRVDIVVSSDNSLNSQASTTVFIN